MVDLMETVDRIYPGGTRVVLTPYVAQRVKIEEWAPNSRLNGGRWDVKTGDAFQGSEADYVVRCGGRLASLVAPRCAASSSPRPAAPSSRRLSLFSFL